jgi:DNA-binding transcriptional LysR family regulator
LQQWQLFTAWEKRENEEIMDIRKCQLFSIIAETGNISKAAERMGYTQSGISHMLKSFEQDVGVQLFHRTRHGVSLTPVGKKFLPYVTSLLEENEKAEEFLRNVHALDIGTLTIGTFASVSAHWLPSILDEFKQEYPHIKLKLKEGGVNEIDQMILNNQVDLAFYSKQDRNDFHFIPIQSDPMVAVLPKDYPLPEGTSVFPVALLDGAPFVLSEEGVDYDVNRILTESNIHPDILCSSTDDYAIMSMVEHRLGISVLPKLMTKGREENLLILPLNPPYYRSLGIALKDYASATPVARAFIRFVKHHFNV